LDLGPGSPRRAQVTLPQVEAVKSLASERMRIAIDLAVCTGQRRGDLLALKREQLTDEGIIFRQSKTGAGVLIEWSHDLQAIVARAKALSPQIPADYLIRKRDGRPYTEDGFSAIWQRLMAKHVKAGGIRFSFHDLRSVSADGAATPEEARARLGHASVVTTRRHYLRGLTKAKPRS
jgi:integrase